MTFATYSSSLILITVVLLLGQRLLLAECRMLVLCGPGFYALGAYASALLAAEVGWSPWLALPAAVLGTGLLSLLVGYPPLRTLRGDFLALATLGINQVVFLALRSAAPGGAAGFAGVPPLQSPLRAFAGEAVDGLAVNAAFAAAAVAVLAFLRRRRLGVLIAAVGADERMVESLGHRPLLVRVQAFVLAAMLAAAAGALHAHFQGVVEPRMASAEAVVAILVGTIVSTARPLVGCLAGAALLVLLPEALQRLLPDLFQLGWQGFTLTWLVYGIVLIILALIVPSVRHAFQPWSGARGGAKVARG